MHPVLILRRPSQSYSQLRCFVCIPCSAVAAVTFRAMPRDTGGRSAGQAGMESAGKRKLTGLGSYLDDDAGHDGLVAEEVFEGVEDITPLGWCFLCNASRPRRSQAGTAGWAELALLQEEGITRVRDFDGEIVLTHLDGEVCPRCVRNARASYHSSRLPSALKHAPPVARDALLWIKHRELRRSSWMSEARGHEDLGDLVGVGPSCTRERWEELKNLEEDRQAPPVVANAHLASAPAQEAASGSTVTISQKAAAVKTSKRIKAAIDCATMPPPAAPASSSGSDNRSADKRASLDE